jgi:hypothetical protein
VRTDGEAIWLVVMMDVKYPLRLRPAPARCPLFVS